MRILAASVQLPPLNESRWPQPPARPPLACPRPEMPADGAVLDFAMAAAREVLDAAGCRASRIDLILGAGSAPDHMIHDPAVVGPRICHPLQRGLGATNAYVFDLVDADWTFVFDVARGFCAQQGYRKVLVLFYESSAGALPDPASGFALPDGVGAMLIEPLDEGAPWRAGFRAHDTAGGLPRASVLPPAELCRGGPKLRLSYSVSKDALDRMGEEALELLGEIRASAGRIDHLVAESWFPGHLEPPVVRARARGDGVRIHDEPPYLGPFALPTAAREILAVAGGPSRSLACLTFAPFHLSTGCMVVTL